MSHKTQKNIILMLILAAMAVVSFLFYRVGDTMITEKIKQIDTLSKSQSDSLIQSVEAEWAKKLQEKTNEVERLKAQPGKIKTIVETHFIYRDTGAIKEVLVIIDSTQVDSIQVFPVYSGAINNEWLKMNVTASKDSIQYQIETRDSILILFSEIPQGIFKRPITQISVFSQSPLSGSGETPIKVTQAPQQPNFFQRIQQWLRSRKN